MKRLGAIAVLLLVIVVAAVAGCSSLQNSSAEEAKFVVEHLSDFQGHAQYFSVESKASIASWSAEQPSIYKSEPPLQDGAEKFVHEIIYKTKSDGLKLVLLNDERPPKIIATSILK